MSIPKRPGCYILNHLASGTFYIGSSIDLYERIHVHHSHLRSGVHKNRLLQSLYDEDQDIHVEFVETADRESAYDLEQSELDIYINHPRCLNFHQDARTGWREVPQRLRDATSKRNRTLHAGNSYRLGMYHSEETKEKMRQAALMRDPSVYRNRPPISEETRERMRAANSRPRAKGRVLSDEHRENIRKAQLERALTTGRHVSIDGVTYPNASRAAEALGCSRRTVVVRIEDPRYPDWKYALSLS